VKYPSLTFGGGLSSNRRVKETHHDSWGNHLLLLMIITDMGNDSGSNYGKIEQIEHIITGEVIWICIGLGVFFYFLESVICVYVFHDRTLIQQIISPNPHEFWIRYFIVFLLIMLGFYAQFIVNKSRKAEERTKIAYAELNQIFETAADGMCMIDRNFNVLRANESFSTLANISKDELIGRKCYEVFSCSACRTPECPLTRILEGEERVECDVKHRDGACIVTATQFRKPDGELIGIVEHFKDITEREQMERAQIELNEVLRVLNKILRHDILNDLTVVCNSVEQYKESKDEKLLSWALECVEKSIKLIGRMKELESLISSGKNLRSYSVREVVDDVIRSYQAEFKVKGDCTIVADEALSCVIDNLVRNAIQHGRANRIDIAIENKGEACEVRIADNGTGIPDELKERIFEEGFSGDSKGTGLGLYIARKTVERYGGNINVEDNKPKGSIFILRLKQSGTKSRNKIEKVGCG